MKAADQREGHDRAARSRLNFSRMRAVVAERLVWTRGVVVGEIGTQEPTQMPLVEHDEVVEAFAVDGANNTLGEGILPRRVGRDGNLVNAQVVDSAVEGVAVDRVAIADEITEGPCRWGMLQRSVGRSRWPSGGP